MVNSHKNTKVDVTLEENGQGRDSVLLSITNQGAPIGMSLTPSEARSLASELIQAVHRAEVKKNLLAGQGSKQRLRREADAEPANTAPLS